MKAIIFGFKQHGKDTVCEHIRDYYNLSFASSSWTACKEFIFDDLRDAYGYNTPEECFDDRQSDAMRKIWYEKICEFNAEDKCRLGRIIFENNDIYCGIRDRDEFYSMKSEGLFDVAIWVDAIKRKPPEPKTSMNLSIHDADHVLDNNGSLIELHQNIIAIHKAVLKPLRAAGARRAYHEPQHGFGGY